mgnify:FL=1
MNYLEGTYSDLVKKLYDQNLYSLLSYEEKEKIENLLIEMVSSVSQGYEKKVGKNAYCGVELKFSDEVKFSIKSSLLQNEKYRGRITCTRLSVIAMYEMFYGMNYDEIIIDGKNVENIKKILFMHALCCMMWHEIAHIYKGHLQLLDTWEKEGTRKQHRLDLQTLEWDADAFAATREAEVIKMYRNEILPNDKTDFATKIICGAIHGMTYWQRTSEDFEEMETKEHPPYLFREAAILSGISELLGNKEDILQYIVGYENAFNRVLNVPNELVMKYFDEAVQEKNYLSSISGRWDELKKELMKYSLFPLEDIESL